MDPQGSSKSSSQPCREQPRQSHCEIPTAWNKLQLSLGFLFPVFPYIFFPLKLLCLPDLQQLKMTLKRNRKAQFQSFCCGIIPHGIWQETRNSAPSSKADKLSLSWSSFLSEVPGCCRHSLPKADTSVYFSLLQSLFWGQKLLISPVLSLRGCQMWCSLPVPHPAAWSFPTGSRGNACGRSCLLVKILCFSGAF